MSGLMSFLTHRGTVRSCQFAIGVAFAVAGLAKLVDLPQLAQSVHNFRILPIWSENLLAVVLPWIEIVAGLSLMLGIEARAGAVVATALMIVFTAAVAAAWARGLDFECGCFGKAGASTIGARKLAENLGLLTLASIASLKGR